MPAPLNLSNLPQERARALHIIARTLFRELSAQGYEPRHIIALSSELIEAVIEALKTQSSEILLKGERAA